MVTRFLLFMLMFGAAYPAFSQQEVQFSQYVFNGLALNPGYAGYKELTNVHLMYRAQWVGLQGAPTTFSASVDGVSPNKKMGFGFQVIDDHLGAQGNLTAFASYAYRLQISDNSKLSLGIGAGIAQYTLDVSKLSTIDSDPLLNSGLNRNAIYPDINFGVFYASEHYFWGLSANDLLSSFRDTDPSYLVIRRSRHYYLQAGALYPLGENLMIKPSILLKEDFRGPTNVDFNTFFLLGKVIWLGASYRTGYRFFNAAALQNSLISADAVSGMVEYNFSEKWRIGYSFDYSTNHLHDVNSGTHEISIGYKFIPKSRPMLSPRYL